MILPLHIFEERYKLMIYRCVTENKPFGVVMIREGSEAGSRPAQMCDVGTTAQITKIDPLDNGRMNIAAIGANRFRIHQVLEEEPYLTALVEEFPVGEADQVQVAPLVKKLGVLLLHYIGLIASLSEVEVELEQLPKDATALAFQAAIVLRAPNEEKQVLLDIAALPELLEQTCWVLRRELSFLQQMLAQVPAWAEQPLLFSPN